MTSMLASVEQKLLQTDDFPALVYFESILAATLRYFFHLVSPIPQVECLYSVKAATFPFLLRLLHRHGIGGFDASSPTEAAFVQRIFGSRARLYVTAPGLSAREIEILKPLGVTAIHVDSLPSLQRLLASSVALPFGIRLNPGIGYAQQRLHEAGGVRSRLGLPIHDLDAALRLCRQYNRRQLGLHLHITCEAPDFSQQTQAVTLLSDVLRHTALDDFTFTHVDLGGGLRPPRWDFENDTLVPRFDGASVQPLAQALHDFLALHQERLAPDFKVLFEPGDLLVCSAAVLASRVIESRHTMDGAAHLILDTNINHFPNVLHYGNTPRVLLPPDTAGAQMTHLAGNSCLGGDLIATVGLDAATQPDHVVFDERGSYEYTQYNFFNGRFRPSVYLYSSAGHLERCKQDRLDDVMAYWKEEPRVFPQPYQSFHFFENIARAEHGLYLYHPDLRMISSFEFDPHDFPPPQGLQEALAAGFARYGTTYGRSLGHMETRARIAAYESGVARQPGLYQPEQVAFTLGATNAIWLTLVGLLGGSMRRLLICCPGYYQFASAAYKCGILWEPIHQQAPYRLTEVGAVPVERLLPSLHDVLTAIRGAPDIGALAIVTPGLPYGRHQPMEDVQFLAEKARQEGWVLIVDETLDGLTYQERPVLDWSWLAQDHPVVRITSISKTFGLAGMRIGYLCATEAACRRPDTGEDFFERIADVADTAYSAPPAVLGAVLEAALAVLDKRRCGNHTDSDVVQYLNNLDRLKQRAARAADILAEWRIPYVMPQAGASIMACLGKLPHCERDAEPFFRALLHKHRMFLELGGHFSQNPAWDFTVARLGLARHSADFEPELMTLSRFYDAYVPSHAPPVLPKL